MDSLEFLLIIAVFAAVIIWYLRNEEAKSDALIGLFALNDDPDIAKHGPRPSYRLKDRTARKPATLRDSREKPDAKVTYSQKDEADAMRQRFRRQDEARYRVKDKAAAYKKK